MQLWRPELELVGISSGSWYHCLPIRCNKDVSLIICFFWYRPTRVVPDQRPLNGRCCYVIQMNFLLNLGNYGVKKVYLSFYCYGITLFF